MSLLKFSPSTICPSASLPCSAKHLVTSSPVNSTFLFSGVSSSKCSSVFSGDVNDVKKIRKNGSAFTVRTSLETVGAAVGQVTEVSKDTFWPIVNAADDKTVVLDMYTQWCGPCKVIAPKFKELSEKYLDCVFLKLDCNQENKTLAKELGIRVVPTFKILKHGKVVKEVTGAKFDDLLLAIDAVRSSSA